METSEDAGAGSADRRIRFLSTDHGCTHHRSGWEYALQSLAPLTHPRGVLFDAMIDNTFAWHLPRTWQSLPITEPWVGIVHMPPNIPADYGAVADPRVYLRSAPFVDSLAACRGLFALSRYQAGAIADLGVPVDALFHPVGMDVPPFDFDLYRSGRPRRVLHVGWWLRRLETFARLDAGAHAKTALAVPVAEAARRMAAVCWRDVEVRAYVPDAAFDSLLSRSVVFVDLIDASANNVVLDCIARATPIFVNRHPAVCEYLGDDYPLLYDDPAQAETMMRDDALIHSAHEYLRRDDLRARLSGDAFREGLRRSRIYRSLPVDHAGLEGGVAKPAVLA
jgi:hypothetical protein